MFDIATRKKYRFPSNKADLSVEQLWDLRLTTTTGFDLDSVAKAVNAQLKAATEESFVSTRSNPAKTELENKLEIVKHIIAIKIAEADKARQQVEKAEKRRKILDALADKENEELNKASKEELLKQLEDLED